MSPHTALADELQAADAEELLETDLLERVLVALRATHEPRLICKTCGQEYAQTERHICPGLQPAPPPGLDAEDLEAMRRDAARYEFFREHVGQMCIHTAGDGLAVLVSVNTDLRSVDPGSLDRAIDSAIEREDSTATKGDGQ